MTHAAQGGGYEKRDVNLRFFTAIMVGLFIILLAGMSASLWFQNVSIERERAAVPPPSPMAVTLPAVPPEPRLQVVPAEDLQKLRAEEDAVLNRYELVDAQGGIVRIPIERAMDLVAERGLPVREEGKGKK
jgi:hypothetical protein